MCADIFSRLMDSNEFIAFVAIVLGCMPGMVAIVSGAIAAVVRTRAREQTRRELAAYVAEGSIDPDKAIALLNAGGSKPGTGDLDEMTG